MAISTKYKTGRSYWVAASLFARRPVAVHRQHYAAEHPDDLNIVTPDASWSTILGLDSVAFAVGPWVAQSRSGSESPVGGS